ncbi:MAG: hypothetical protein ORN51_05255, partial [Akkermansiaceae bacterium]|nr:hypothetical protein [Akkermansiaceae bacterium]
MTASLHVARSSTDSRTRDGSQSIASAAALRGGGFFGSAGSTNPMWSGVWAAAAHTVARAKTRLYRV